MSVTKKKSEKKRPSAAEKRDGKTPSLALTKLCESSESQVKPMNLSSSVGKHLLSMMQKVTETDVTPQTVLAACQCAKEIRELIRLNHSIS